MSAGLDIEVPEELVAYLRANEYIGPDESPSTEVLRGGVSNRTVLVGRPNGESWVIKQALERLRVEVEWHSCRSRINREALALKWLVELTPPGTITPLVFHDPDNYLFAMQAVPRPHENWKSVLLSGRVRFEHFEQAGKLLGTIHKSIRGTEDEFAAEFRDRSFFESLRLEPFYRYSSCQVPAAACFLDRLIKDTLSCRSTLVHGDFSPKNILIYEKRLVLIDHEVVHLGDGAFDLGFCLAHFLSKANHIPELRTSIAKAVQRFWQAYCKEEAGVDEYLEERAIRHTLGCLLARVAGRSTLEYLTDEERSRQRDVVLDMMSDRPNEVPAFADYFIRRL